MLKRIVIENYTSLHDVKVDLNPLTVCIGNNGTEKRSFLDIFCILSQLTTGRLQKTKYKWPLKSKLSILAYSKIKPKNHNMSYGLVLKPKNSSYEVVTEAVIGPGNLTYLGRNEDFVEIMTDDRSLKKTELTHKEATSLFYFKDRLHPQAKEFKKDLEAIEYNSSIGLIAARHPQRSSRNSKRVDLDGSNLCYYLHELARNMNKGDKEKLELIKNTLRAAFPKFIDLFFPYITGEDLNLSLWDFPYEQMYTLNWIEEKRPVHTNISELSDGVIKFLHLITFLQSDLPPVVLLDQPEIGLHPELLKHIVYFLREASKRSNVIVKTHSVELVAQLKPEEVLVFDSENGKTTTTWASEYNVTKWLKDYNLGQIWKMDLIGGR